MSDNTKAIKMDMLNGSLSPNLIRFSLPIAASTILQQLFNSADVAVVGRFAGSEALAAVGANVANVGVFVNLIVGLAIGPNVVMSMLIGQGRLKEVNKVVHNIITFAIVLGLGLMALGMLLARPILVLTSTPDNILDAAWKYLMIYLAGIPFIMLYNFGSSILRSIGDSKRPLYALLVGGIVNVILNLFFVIVLHMQVTGVALATVLSNVLSAGIVLFIIMHESEVIRFSFSKIRLDSQILKRILIVGVPSGIQYMIFSVSNIFIQAGINSFGNDAIAGSVAALNFEYFTYAIAAAFAQATITFTSQNYGARKYDRCSKVFWLTLLYGALFTGILAGIFSLWRRTFIGIYTTDEAVIAYGIIRMTHVVTYEAITAFTDVPAAALRGIGYSVAPAVISVIGTVGFRLVWMVTIFKMFPTFEVLMDVYPISWVVIGTTTAVLYLILRRRKFV